MALLAGAGASLPFIACLTLVAGRRGNGLFCLWGGYRLLYCALILASFGPVWIIGSYLADVAGYGTSVAQKLAPLFHNAGLPWSGSCMAWLAGWLAMALACTLLRRELAAFQGDSYRLAYVKMPLAGCLAACGLFIASYILINWPFAGLPADLSWERASQAIIRHAIRQYYMNFCSAGAFALIAALYACRNVPTEQKITAVRWLGVWAAGGCLPGLVQSWGILMGLGASGRLAGTLSQGLWGQTAGLALLTIAFFCWCLLVWRPRFWRLCSLAGAALLLLRTCAPFLLGFTNRIAG